MSVKQIRFSGLVTTLALFFSLSGCGKTDPAASSTADGEFLEGLLDEIDLTEKVIPEHGGAPDMSDSPGQTQKIRQVSAAAVSSEPLTLQVTPGDRFPMVKTVTQSLVQKSAENPVNAGSNLELHMVLQVDEVRSDAMKLSVRYTRVAYEHNIGGNRVRVDSNTQGAVPVGLLPYVDMVDNGFAFWLGRDNTIREVVGYNEFLQQCVRRVPDGQRQQMLKTISKRLGADSVSQLVDDTVGLLPASNSSASASQIGDVWTRKHTITGLNSATLNRTCRILALNEQTADVDITGRIVALDSRIAGANSSPGIRITGGRCLGSCVIDRATGLPLKLNRSQYITMAVTTQDGQTIEQQKRIQTIIETASVKTKSATIQQVSSKTLATNSLPPRGSNDEAVIQTPYSSSPLPQKALLPSTVRAIYPD